MRKIFAMSLIMTMSIGLAACGTNSTNTSTDGVVNSDATTEDASSAETTDEATTGAAEEVVEDLDWSVYDDLIDQIRSTTDTAARVDLMHQAEDMLLSTETVIPLVSYKDAYMLNPDVSGLFCTIYGTKFWMNAKSASGETTLSVTVGSEPEYLDPGLSYTVDGAAYASNSFIGLYTYNEDSEPVPALADHVDVSDDQKTYTVTLKSGLKWSDGSSLTASDFEYAWKRAADINTGSNYQYIFSMFDGYSDSESSQINVTALDDTTLEFVLSNPCNYIYDLLAFPTYMPVPQAAVEAADPDGTNPGAWCQEAGFITDGAYTLSSWTHNESMVYTKNPYYYDADHVSYDEVHVMLSDDDTAIYSAYQTGDVDMIDTIPAAELTNLLANPPEDFYNIDQLGTYYIIFNVNADIFADMSYSDACTFRRAINLLIDRQAVSDARGLGEKVVTTFIPDTCSDGNGGIFEDSNTSVYYNADDYDANVDEAISLLESLGYEFDDSGMLSADTPISFSYTTNETTQHVAVAESIQADLAAVGITMDISTQEWAIFCEERTNGNFELAREGWSMDFSDPINMLEIFTTTSANNDAQLGK